MAGAAAGIEAISGFEEGRDVEMRLSLSGDKAVTLPPKFLQVYVAGTYIGYMTVGGSLPTEKNFFLPPGLLKIGERFKVALLESGGGPSAVKLESIGFHQPAKESHFDAFHIDFARRINDRALLARNWSLLEDWGVWSDGLTAMLRVPRPTGMEAFGVVFDVVLPHIPAVRSAQRLKVPPQRVAVSVEGNTIFEGQLKLGDSKLSFAVPPSRSGQRYAELEFRFPDAVALDELPNPWDRRRIAMGVKSVLVHSCEVARCPELRSVKPTGPD